MNTKFLFSSLTAVSLITTLNAGGIDMPVAKKAAQPVAVAPVAVAPQSDWTFYVGGLVGAAFGDARMTSLTTDDATVNAVETHKKRDQTPFALAGVFAGVLYNFSDMFYTGLEVEGNLDEMKLKANVNDSRLVGSNPDFSFSLSRKYQVIPSVIFGYKCTDSSSVYMKLGAGITGYDFTESAGVGVKNTVRTNVVNFVPAIGFSTDISKSIAMRLELSGELFGKDVVANSGAVVANATRQDSTAKVNNVALKFGVAWKI